LSTRWRASACAIWFSRSCVSYSRERSFMRAMMACCSGVRAARVYFSFGFEGTANAGRSEDGKLA
jgi:hypothetical protein